MTTDVRKSWTTSVSDVEDADVFIRGYSLGDIIGNMSFAAATYLLIRGKLPTPGQTKMIDAVLCSVLDYSLKKPGTVAARYCVSGNPSMVAGLATAMLSAGEYTLAPDSAGTFIRNTYDTHRKPGASIDECAEAAVDEIRQTKMRVGGFGHPNFKYLDPRAQKLKTIAVEAGVWGDVCDWYEAVHRAFIKRVTKPEMAINEVGMMAAILTEMSFTPDEMTGLALLSTFPGVVAHISEELQSKTRIRTLPDDIVDYARERKELNRDMAAAGWTA
ncbi:citryl-CoA lyase [Rhizobium sp. NZLR1b]|uniref:citryl-CoA lyase n=1 Tax=Rhizobium sp. NZLR1b TaxID=2731099 RepID=UPI001C82A361|nr:citryl-CoA lyase [Rhizobium sp. NZLR1b]MBX5173344.1 citryl-CoA lyase [Rhizobium sp. NZLR1b]